VPLEFIINPEIEAGQLAALRKAVGWDARKEKLEQIVGCTYLTACCFDQGSLVGFVDVLSDGVDDALIRSLVVDPRYQGRGIGLELLRMVNDTIKRDQIKTVNVLFEPELTPFYKKAGFKIISGGLIDNEEG
jgi:N-acetylglutamate synthase-like GNAT family acetyltransferase